MFSSTSNTLMSPFPQFYFASSSSSFHQPSPPPPPPPPPILPNQNDNIFLHQNHSYDTLFSLSTAQIPNTLINLGVSNTTTTTNIMTGTTSTTTKQLDDHRLIINNNNNAGLLQVAPNFLPKKSSAAAKKDRHSKIYTAQGLRDRRVRLSIDIAREFFDLHDMLGFDKASKTLEWLLTKSKKAIKELSRSKLKPTTNNITTTYTITTTTNLSASTNSECEQAVSEVNEHTISADHNNNNFINLEQDMSLSAPKSKGLNKKVDIEALSESALMNLLAKESRAKARARARARTKEKRHGYCTTTATTTSSYSINKRSHNVEKCGLSTQISNQFGTQVVPVEELDQDRSIRRISPNSGLRDQDQGEAEPDQDVMIKRKFRFPYSISSSGYNVAHHQGQFSGISKCLRIFFTVKIISTSKASY
ncbi:hypothetical protein TIFTF001_026160 [Ficus carica]|uniref:Uncharacterized protein n=1 Tax=Ficus carica TaxID=3494 RepID=A0AA88IT04_FICCA|nr:hypothetical protein TIFTF001_026160 [Ficus carica]